MNFLLSRLAKKEKINAQLKSLVCMPYKETDIEEHSLFFLGTKKCRLFLDSQIHNN